MAKILMPKATAVWLIDNTTLTFEQIADFCELHPLEVKGIADGEVAENMRGADPVASGELTREEIEKGEKDKTYRLKPPAAEARQRARAQEEGRALHAGVAPQGPAGRHRLVPAPPPGSDRRADLAPDRHHQVDHRVGALAPALECAEPQAGRPCDAGPVLADRARRGRLEGRRQEGPGPRGEGRQACRPDAAQGRDAAPGRRRNPSRLQTARKPRAAKSRLPRSSPTSARTSRRASSPSTRPDRPAHRRPRGSRAGSWGGSLRGVCTNPPKRSSSASSRS